MKSMILWYNSRRVSEVFPHQTDPNQNLFSIGRKCQMATRKFTTWQELFKQKQQLLITLFTPEEIRNEEWRDVVGYEGAYSISNLGRVRRDLAARGHKVGKILKPGMCWRYLGVGLCYRKTQKTFYIHQLVARAFIGQPPKGMEVNHIKQPTTNNRLSNLEYVTHQENIRLAVKEGLMPKGDKHGTHTKPESVARGEKQHMSKLKNSDIDNIFRLRASGLTYEKIGRIIGINGSTVGGIVRGRHWKEQVLRVTGKS